MEAKTALLSAAGIVVLATSVWTAFTVSSFDARLTALEAAPPPTQAAHVVSRTGVAPAVVASADRDRPHVAARDATEAVDFDDPEVRGQIAQVMADEEQRQSDERSERFLESLTAEAETFAADQGLDAGTTQRVVAELERRSTAFIAVKEDVHAGDLSWIDARREFEAIREDSDAELRRLVGDDAFEVLNQQLWGDRKRWH